MRVWFPSIRLEVIACPHFSSSFEWFPGNNLEHLHTLHVPNNFLDYPTINDFVSNLQASALKSIDFGKHQMFASETLAIVEALTAPKGIQLEVLRLDVSKYRNSENPPHVGWQQFSETTLHLATNVRHASIVGCLTDRLILFWRRPRSACWTSGSVTWGTREGSTCSECCNRMCVRALPLRVRGHSLTGVPVRACVRADHSQGASMPVQSLPLDDVHPLAEGV